MLSPLVAASLFSYVALSSSTLAAPVRLGDTPTTSPHKFNYRTKSMMLSLRDLEAANLDLGHGRLFGYGTHSALRVSGISPENYLTRVRPDVSTEMSIDKVKIETRLIDLLRASGETIATGCIGDIWMLTIPAYFGVEMNPLTMYFCYDQNGPVLAVLEIHNTMAERHSHVLRMNHESRERAMGSGFDYAWVFPKQFHVSPFSPRDGFYECHLNAPTSAPSEITSDSSPLPLPFVRLRLLTSDNPPQVRLIATQRTIAARPLTSISLLSTVATEPFAWLLTFARILYQAYVLHYLRRLDVYMRPEPHGLPSRESHITLGDNQVQDPNLPSGGLLWLAPSGVNCMARTLLERFLHRRTHDTNLKVELVPTNPFEKSKIFGRGVGDPDLTIYYRSWEAFAFILEAPTPQLALALARVQPQPLFSVSDEGIFVQLFSPLPTAGSITIDQRITQFLRRKLLPAALWDMCQSPHVLDQEGGWLATRVLVLRLLSAIVEHGAFVLARARLVPGQEPWLFWKRVAEALGQHPEREVHCPSSSSSDSD
ncbi:hypothetical protein BKA62DRAFT_825575 [Auriculariales sp. MPI-PUGE-AT-0066]|nr:hypothetical protein BKA62DRAFT_825575 [Auriculariales sp. MPI-PUGE-AT-0066]